MRYFNETVVILRLYEDYMKTILKYRISNVYLSYMYRICIELNCGINAVLWRVYCGFAMGLFYVGHIVAADAFPSAVVERTDKSLLLVRRSSVPHRF